MQKGDKVRVINIENMMLELQNKYPIGSEFTITEVNSYFVFGKKSNIGLPINNVEHVKI